MCESEQSRPYRETDSFGGSTGFWYPSRGRGRVGIAIGLMAVIGACANQENKPALRTAATSAATEVSPDVSTNQKWYTGGQLSKASMSEWMLATERNRLATSA